MENSNRVTLKSPYGLPITSESDEDAERAAEEAEIKRRRDEKALMQEARWWRECEITKLILMNLEIRHDELREQADEADDRKSVRLHAKAQEVKNLIRVIEEVGRSNG